LEETVEVSFSELTCNLIKCVSEFGTSRVQKNILMLKPQLSLRSCVMPTAFVLINTEIGSETDVLKELKKVEGVEEPYAVYGVYDIVARVTADTMDRLKEIVTWRIRRLDKVRSTLTMIVVEEKK